MICPSVKPGLYPVFSSKNSSENPWPQIRVAAHVLCLILPQNSISADRLELGGPWAEIGSGCLRGDVAKVGNFFSPDLYQNFRDGRGTSKTTEYHNFFPTGLPGTGPGDREGTLREKCREPWRPNRRCQLKSEAALQLANLMVYKCYFMTWDPSSTPYAPKWTKQNVQIGFFAVLANFRGQKVPLIGGVGKI